MAVSMTDPEHPGVPAPLFKTTTVDYLGARSAYAPSADGQRFLVNTQIGEVGPQSIHVFTGWQGSATIVTSLGHS